MYGKQEKTPQNSPEQVKEPLKKPKGISEEQTKTLLKWSNNPEGMEYLNSKGIYKEEDVLNLTSKQAWEIINEKIKG